MSTNDEFCGSANNILFSFVQSGGVNCGVCNDDVVSKESA